MGKSTPSPDMGAVQASLASSQAAENEYKLGDDQLAFEKQQWGQDQPLIQQITDDDITGQTNQNNFSKTMQDAYTGTFLPLSEDYAAKAQAYDTPGQETLNAGAAEANVGTQFDNARGAATAQLEGFGVNPADTRYGSLDIGTRTQEAAATAGAGTKAIQDTKALGMGYEQSAIQAGQGIAGSSVASSGAATGAGSGGSSATLGGLTGSATAMAEPTQWFNSGAQNMGQYVNAVNGFNYAQNQAASIANQGMAGIGSAVGGIIGMFDEGGPVPDQGVVSSPTSGGFVSPGMSPSQGQQTDDVNAKLNANEFVIPKDVTQFMGIQHFVKQIDTARKQMQKFSQRQDIGGQPAPQQGGGVLPSPGGPPPQAPTQPVNQPAFVSRQGVIPSPGISPAMH